MRLCYFEGRTHDDAAAALGWPVGTVRGRLSRAREMLRTRLKRNGVSAVTPRPWPPRWPPEMKPGPTFRRSLRRRDARDHGARGRRRGNRRRDRRRPSSAASSRQSRSNQRRSFWPSFSFLSAGHGLSRVGRHRETATRSNSPRRSAKPARFLVPPKSIAMAIRCPRGPSRGWGRPGSATIISATYVHLYNLRLTAVVRDGRRRRGPCLGCGHAALDSHD